MSHKIFVYFMNRLVNLLGTIYMDGYDPNRPYPHVMEELTRLQNATPQVISQVLMAKDIEEGNENTPLMYAAIFLRTEWIERILELALRVEQNSPAGPLRQFRRTMLAERNANGENALVLLVEAEMIDVEETGENMPMDRIHLMVHHGAVPNDDVGGQSAQQFAEENGLHVVWGAVGHLKRPKKNKSLVYGKRNSSRRRHTHLDGSIRRNKSYGNKVHAVRSRKTR